MKKLINMSTPANDTKKILFQKMVRNEDGTKMVIDMAIELGYSMDDTLNMLKTCCL